MPVDRGDLLELYSIALEEARHRDRLYTQTWIAVVITGSVLFAAISLFLKEPSAISGCCIMWFMIGLVLILAPLFTNSIFRLAKEGDICRGIAREIEDALLAEREQSGAEGLICLLVRQKIDGIKPTTKCEYIKWVCRGQGLRLVYPSAVVVIWILLSFLVRYSMK